MGFSPFKHQFDWSINELVKCLILLLPYFSEVQLIAVYPQNIYEPVSTWDQVVLDVFSEEIIVRIQQGGKMPLHTLSLLLHYMDV